MARTLKVHPAFSGAVPAGRLSEVTISNPERTAYRIQDGFAGDYVFQEWPNRASMLKTIELQGKREPRSGDWRPALQCDGAVVMRRGTCPHGFGSYAH